MTLNREEASAPYWGLQVKRPTSVDFGGGVVIVAGAQVQVAADAVLLPAHHQGDFAMGL